MGNTSTSPELKTCKYCGKPITWACFEHAPSVWFHIDTELAKCDPTVRVATPNE